VAPEAEIAVVIYDYIRKEYLLSAVRSIAAQTLPRDRFELVVSKNFDDPLIDRELERSGAITIHDEDPRFTRCWHRAINASRAPIVTFLDDDDEYEPDRLERILETMREKPDVGYYRNRVRTIDGGGQPIPPERWRSAEQDKELDALGPLYIAPEDKTRLLELARRRNRIWPSFNVGTIAIRRELLDGELGRIYEDIRLTMDMFLFVAGVLSPRAMYVDNRRLTRYRYAPKARYRLFSGNSHRTISQLGDVMEDYRMLSALAARHGRSDLAKWLSRESEYSERLFRDATLLEQVTAGAERSEVTRLSKEYLRFLLQTSPDRAFRPDVWKTWAYAFAYLCAPTTTRRFAEVRFGSGGPF
jgi:glycosyltransferase involved in cell wall biosynthesis